MRARITDRFASIKYDFDKKDKLKILESREGRKQELPVVELPLKANCVDIKMQNSLYSEVNNLALNLDSKKVMSFVRAQTHIVNFMKANADLNGRMKTAEDDLKLFKMVLPLYFGAHSSRAKIKVREVILQSSMEGE